MQKIKLIIGLGNPNAKFENTYHNVGHFFVDYWGRGLKSDVFMNKSGEFVNEQIKKNKIRPDQLLIVHDDSDIELGKFKFSFGRNSAGHKGVQSIINYLKTKNFWRLRVGIRPRSAFKTTRGRSRPTADELVLKVISPANRKKIEGVFAVATKNLLH